MIKSLALLFLLTTSVNAAEYINFTVGKIGILDPVDRTTQYGVEYRFDNFTDWRLIPAVGITFLVDGSKYGYSDLRHDFYVTSNWIVSPSFGVGLFDNRHTINLGTAIEFRSGIELSYEFTNKIRLGASIFHLSNGGISNTNPGTESIVLSFSVPVGI